MTYTLICFCGNEIPLKRPKPAVICPKCGRMYLYKIRSRRYVYGGKRR